VSHSSIRSSVLSFMWSPSGDVPSAQHAPMMRVSSYGTVTNVSTSKA